MYISNKLVHFYLFFGILTQQFVYNSFADVNNITNHIVIIGQQMFNNLSSQDIIIESLGGYEINSTQLSPEANMQLERLKTSIIPQIELKASVPQDIMQIVVSKPKPKQMIRLGIISPPKKPINPAWFNELRFNNEKLICIATNISLLNLSLVFADTFNCEFGITTNGEIIFRNKTSAARSKYPFYLIKSAGKSSTVITNEIIQKDKQQKNLIIFAICFVFFMIATLAISFFKRRKNNRV